MARTVNEEEFFRKRNEILDVAQRLVQSKGYEQMSIQDILDALSISKGAFYHYFPSKPALLAGLVERICDGIAGILTQALRTPGLSAVGKLNRFFANVGQWKTREKALFIAFTRVWMMDDNAVMRQKTRTAMVERIAPLLNEIVQQGIDEQQFSPAYPARAGEILAVLIQDMNDAVGLRLVDDSPEYERFDGMMETYAAYGDVMERMLGAPADSIIIVERTTLAAWFHDECAPVAQENSVE